MIEIINIIFLILSMIWITFFPLIKGDLSSNLINYKISNLERIGVNLSFFLNILLILSFYYFNQQYIFFTLIFLSLGNFFLFY